MQLATEGFGDLDAATDHHYVDVVRWATQVVIAHKTADDKGLQTSVIDDALYAAEYSRRKGVSFIGNFHYRLTFNYLRT